MQLTLDINPQRIAQHGKELRSDIIPALEKVTETLNADGVYNLEGGSFSITMTMAAMAYPGALQFAFEDLRTHREMLDRFASGIETTAKNYQAAEENSTVKKA
ncbi:hypothetical protein Arub01_34860 [Actinomadura rubrobrunea]|uniref:Uncharacterized protein n=1 Tax=Actinomadura rubrobrunea TaxID=115335 RepID=A0A9W6PWX2_9ACTN|nr:hypothetical protein [Actinomadura rubrobrunea]GLW65242.1 hypothetical protein Arub01_34860 [Actinomadura rubrobrunea]